MDQYPTMGNQADKTLRKVKIHRSKRAQRFYPDGPIIMTDSQSQSSSRSEADGSDPIKRFWALYSDIDRVNTSDNLESKMFELLTLTPRIFVSSPDATRALVELIKTVQPHHLNGLILLLELRKYAPAEYQKFETQILTEGRRKLDGADYAVELLITYLRYPELRKLTDGTPLNFEAMLTLFFEHMNAEDEDGIHGRGEDLIRFIDVGEGYLHNEAFLRLLPKMIDLDNHLYNVVLGIPKRDPSLASQVIRILLESLTGTPSYQHYVLNRFLEMPYFWTLPDENYAVCDLMLKLAIYDLLPLFLVKLWLAGQYSTTARLVERIFGLPTSEEISSDQLFEVLLIPAFSVIDRNPEFPMEIVAEFFQRTNLMNFLDRSLVRLFCVRILVDTGMTVERRISFFNHVLKAAIDSDNAATKSRIEILREWVSLVEAPVNLITYLHLMLDMVDLDIVKSLEAKYRLILLGRSDETYAVYNIFEESNFLENIVNEAKTTEQVVVFERRYENLTVRGDLILGFKDLYGFPPSYQFFIADRKTGYYKFYYPHPSADGQVRLYQIVGDLIYLIVGDHLIVLRLDTFRMIAPPRPLHEFGDPTKVVRFTASSRGFVFGMTDSIRVFDADRKLLHRIGMERVYEKKDFFSAGNYLCYIKAGEIIGLAPSSSTECADVICLPTGYDLNLYIEHAFSERTLYYTLREGDRHYLVAFDTVSLKEQWRVVNAERIRRITVGQNRLAFLDSSSIHLLDVNSGNQIASMPVSEINRVHKLMVGSDRVYFLENLQALYIFDNRGDLVEQITLKAGRGHELLAEVDGRLYIRGYHF